MRNFTFQNKSIFAIFSLYISFYSLELLGSEKIDPITNMQSSTVALVKAISEGTVYRIDNAHSNCPSIIQITKDDYIDNSKKIEPGDIQFYARGFEQKENRISTRNFTFENNSFNFRPSIKEGKTKILESNCDLVGGYACRKNSQTTEKGSILFEGNAKIFSVAMTAFINSSFKFDSVRNKVTYIFKSKGSEDVVCNYGLAPELVNDIKSYAAEQAAMRAKYSKNVDNSNRSNNAKSTGNLERVRVQSSRTLEK